MESPTGLIPEPLMSAGMKRSVLDYLLAQPWPGDFKLQVLAGWQLVTGGLTSASDQRIVSLSGWGE